MSKDENKKILLLCKREFIIKLIISILLIGILLVIPIFYSYGIDYINESNFNKAYLIFIILGITFIIYRILEIINQKSYYRLYSKLYKNYMNKGIEKTCNNSLYSLSRFSLSEYSSILSEDFELLSDYYSTLVIRIVEIFQFVYIIIYFFFINKTIGIITLCLSIFVISMLFYFNKFIVITNEKRRGLNDIRISLFQEIFLSIKEIKGFNILKKLRNNIDYDIDNYIKSNIKLNVDKYNLRQISLGIVDIFKVICLIYSVYLIVNGKITIGVLTIVYNYYTKLSEMFTSIILLNESVSNVKVAKKRIYKLFQYAKDKKVLDNDYNDVEGNIKFIDVLYGNRKKPYLNNVSFNIVNKSFNVLNGDVKACKGVFDLLLKYNEKHSGEIYIDNVEIKDYTIDNISNIIGYIMEKPIFFNKSIKDNLMLFDNNFENIMSVCERLKINNKILELPDGYNTIIKSGIIDDDLLYMLSIAKIFLKNSRIILIEDIFDKLTRFYQDLVFNILLNLKKEHTIILITKNKKIISNENIDNIYFFNGNELDCFGNYQKLYNDSEMYRNYYEKL